MKSILFTVLVMTSFSAFSNSYSCKTVDVRCGFTTLDLSEVKNGQMILTYDAGPDSYEEKVGVPGVDRECSDKTTLNACVKSDTVKKLVISQEDGVEGIQISLNKNKKTLQYEQTVMVPPFNLQIRQKMCKFTCEQI